MIERLVTGVVRWSYVQDWRSYRPHDSAYRHDFDRTKGEHCQHALSDEEVVDERRKGRRPAWLQERGVLA